MREITVGVVAPAYVNRPLWVAQQRDGVIPRDLRSASGALAAVTRAMRSSGLIPPAELDPAAVAADHSYLG